MKNNQQSHPRQGLPWWLLLLIWNQGVITSTQGKLTKISSQIVKTSLLANFKSYEHNSQNCTICQKSYTADQSKAYKKCAAEILWSSLINQRNLWSIRNQLWWAKNYKSPPWRTTQIFNSAYRTSNSTLFLNQYCYSITPGPRRAITPNGASTSKNVNQSRAMLKLSCRYHLRHHIRRIILGANFL